MSGLGLYGLGFNLGAPAFEGSLRSMQQTYHQEPSYLYPYPKVQLCRKTKIWAPEPDLPAVQVQLSTPGGSEFSRTQAEISTAALRSEEAESTPKVQVEMSRLELSSLQVVESSTPSPQQAAEFSTPNLPSHPAMFPTPNLQRHPAMFSTPNPATIHPSSAIQSTNSSLPIQQLPMLSADANRSCWQWRFRLRHRRRPPS